MGWACAWARHCIAVPPSRSSSAPNAPNAPSAPRAPTTAALLLHYHALSLTATRYRALPPTSADYLLPPSPAHPLPPAFPPPPFPPKKNAS